MVKNEEFNYIKAKQELVGILDWFESGDPDLDKALENYKQAELLIGQIEKYLKDTEKKLKISVSKG